MANRVYGSAAWYVEWDSADIDALYKPRRETRFVVARRLSGAPPWHSHGGAGDDADDDADGREDDAGGEEEGAAGGEQSGGGGGGATGGGATDEEESDEEYEIRRGGRSCGRAQRVWQRRLGPYMRFHKRTIVRQTQPNPEPLRQREGAGVALRAAEAARLDAGARCTSSSSGGLPTGRR